MPQVAPIIRKGRTVGYANKHVELDFSYLGDGCQVTMNNPKLLSQDALEQFAPPGVPQLDPLPGETTEQQRARGLAALTDEQRAAMNSGGRKMLASLIVSWTMWDVDTDEPLPLPSTDLALFGRVPIEVVRRLTDELSAVTNPQ